MSEVRESGAAAGAGAGAGAAGVGAGSSVTLLSRPYILSTELPGHSLDVRSVATTNHDCILSASRDNTAKLWHPEGIKDFVNVTTFKGHTNFVASVCYLDPCQGYPNGLILTASNDMTICAYTIQDPTPCVTFKGHEGTVCCLYPSKLNTPGTFYSASWDSTAKVWSVNIPKSPLVNLKGHTAAVWGVIELGNQSIATCSADKTIIIWDKLGTKLKTLTGHKDCVRCMAVADPDSFLSCSNDTSIILWNNNGDCINTYYGHTNYVYSICVNPTTKGLGFFSCGEDATLRVWSGGDNVQTIQMPAQSIWSVACLLNGDVITGSSDGIVRVFTTDNTKYSDAVTVKAFDEEAEKFHTASSQEIGGIKVTDLPGPEILYEPGKSDGQTKLIRTGAKVKCYSWSAETRTWNEIGDVMGSAGPTEGKTMYLGKEYDYVFNVDIEDGKPPLKLPYNIGEDCWVAAQSFIHKNNLPQVYLEQVANFIIKNSGQTGGVQSSANGNYADPFTGESRYVPTGAENKNNPVKQSVSQYFPQKTYLRFEQGNISLILDKMKEFNKREDNPVPLTDVDLERVAYLGTTNASLLLDSVDHLKQLLGLPKDLLFPILDITRLAVRNAKLNEALFDENTFGPLIMEILLDNLIPGNTSANQMLSLRILANAFMHIDGEIMVLRKYEDVLNSLICFTEINKNIQIAASTVLLNLTIALAPKADVNLLCDCILHAITNFMDEEAFFRSLVALGTLLSLSPNRIGITSKLISHNICHQKLKSLSVANYNNQQKIIECSKNILALL